MPSVCAWCANCDDKRFELLIQYRSVGSGSHWVDCGNRWQSAADLLRLSWALYLEMLMKSLQRLITILALFCLAPAAIAAEQIGVSNAWIPQAPPGATMLAGYLTIKNNRDTVVNVLAAQSDLFDTVSVHQTVIENGVARMRELHSLEIAPGQEVKFAPGGMHLMLMQPRKDISPGDRIEITLMFSDGTRVPAMFDVRAAEAAGSEGHEHHH